MLRSLAQFRIDITHLLDDHADDLDERRLSAAEQPGVPNGSAQNSAQYVTSSFVRGENTIREKDRHCTTVVRDDAEGRSLFALAIAVPDGFLDRFDQRHEQIRVEVVRFALHDRGDSLEASSSIDRWLGQRHQRAIRLPIELHEDEIPELEESSRFRAFDERRLREFLPVQLRPLALCALGKAPVARNVGEIDEYLRAWPARARIGHLPEVVV